MKRGTLYLVIITLVIIAFVLPNVTGNFLFRSASTTRVTSTIITSPASNSQFNLSAMFTVTAKVSCLGGGSCNSVKSTISFSPISGLFLPNNDATHSLGSISSGSSKTTSWSVKSNAVGNYTITVSTTSSNAARSSASISVLIINNATVVQPDSCIDSDGGFNVLTQGTVSGYKGGKAYSNTDYCTAGNATAGNNTLVEYICVGNGATSSSYNCSLLNANGTAYGCLNGACAPK